MNRTPFIRHVTLTSLVIASLAGAATAAPLTHPSEDPKFTILPGGQDLLKLSSHGSRLKLEMGSGYAFTDKQQAAYEKLKEATKTIPNYKMQWSLMDLDTHQVIDHSLSSNMKIFGASSSKIFVGGVLLNKQNGTLTKSQIQLMADMLVPSDNNAWKELQRQIGDGVDDRGRERIHNFTQKMGYLRMRGFQGNWGKIHGNELTADETTDYLYDIYQQNFVGAETLWKYMHTCRTGALRARKYLPKDVYVGAKTGSYDGESIDPETGNPTTVDVFNHVVTFKVDGKQYGLTILANTGVEELTALMAGGLFREYTRYHSISN